MARQFLKPAAEGLIVPSLDHNRKPLPAAGGWVESSTYWSRRLASQEVVDDTEAQTAREEADAKRAAKANKDIVQ